jgi:hypothetical protein
MQPEASTDNKSDIRVTGKDNFAWITVFRLLYLNGVRLTFFLDKILNTSSIFHDFCIPTEYFLNLKTSHIKIEP